MSQTLVVWWMAVLTTYVAVGATVNVIFARRNMRNAKINLDIAEQLRKTIGTIRTHFGVKDGE